MTPEQALERTWRWYWVLLIANALDLLFTYTAVERGFEELNLVVRPILLTPWLASAKFSVLGVLAAALILALPMGGNPLRILRMVRIGGYVYLGLAAFHFLGLYARTLSTVIGLLL